MNANLIAALDAARADEVLERARNVIAKQDEIIAARADQEVRVKSFIQTADEFAREAAATIVEQHTLIMEQDKIIAALREVQAKIAYDPGCGCPCCNINERLLAGRAAQALAEGV